MVDLYIKLIVTIIYTAALVALNFSIFNIPIKGNDKQIVILAVAVGSTNFYLKFMVHSSVFIIVQTVVYLVVLTLLRKYPLIYSFIVCFIGSLAASIIDAIVSFIDLKINSTPMDQAMNNLKHFTILHFIVSILYLLISFALVKNKIGFKFVTRRFIGKYSLNTSTFLWSILIIVSTGILQFITQNFSVYSLNSYVLIGVSLALIISVVYAYFQNKKSLADRYESRMETEKK